MFGLSSAETAALALSLGVSAQAVLWSLPLAVGLGWLLGSRRFPGHAVFNALVHLPLVLPPVVLGYLLLVLLGRNGLVGGPLYDWFGLRVAFTGEAVVIACSVVGFPLMVRAIRPRGAQPWQL
jgi:molybdate transport system permease protein